MSGRAPGLRVSHAKRVKISLFGHLHARISLCFAGNGWWHLHCLKGHKRVDSVDKRPRVRGLFAKTKTNLVKPYEEIHEENPGVHVD
jgi:hypothetical protein